MKGMLENLEWKVNSSRRFVKYYNAKLPDDMGTIMVVRYIDRTNPSISIFELYYTLRKDDAGRVNGKWRFPLSVKTFDEAKALMVDMLEKGLQSEIEACKTEIKKICKSIHMMDKVIARLKGCDENGEEQ